VSLTHDEWQGIVEVLMGLMVELLDNVVNNYDSMVYNEIICHPYMTIEQILDSWDDKAYESFDQILESMVARVLYGNPLKCDCPCTVSVQAVRELVLVLGHQKGKALPAALVESFNLVKKEQRTWIQAHS